MCPDVSLSVRAGSVQGNGTRRRVRLSVTPANSGDHTSAYFFLASVFQAPSREEFKASLEDPYYEPNDRLLVRRGGALVGHAQLTHRTLRFGPLRIPVAGLHWLATKPECCNLGVGSRLLDEAEKEMARRGAMVGLLRTTIPHFFRRAGWALCGRHCHSQATVRGVLSSLCDRKPRRLHPGQRPRRPLQIRPWRRWETNGLVRIYNQSLPEQYGAFERTEPYWRWLIDRRAYDQIYVALDGPNAMELDKSSTAIVGYAVIQGDSIVELVTVPQRRRVATDLLGHVCGDAIEHGRHSIQIHAPPPSSLHKLFRRADGERYHHEAYRGEVRMARLLRPLKLLRELCPEVYRRAEEAGLPRPLELGLLADGRKYRLDVTRQSARVVSRRLGRDYLCLNIADFTRLVLGQLDWPRALADHRVEATSDQAGEIAQVLFPQLPLWYPPLDDLQA